MTEEATLGHQIIKTPGGESLVILPLAEFEALRDAADAARHASTMAALSRGDEERLSAEETLELVGASTPLAFWRKKRGFTQAVLGERVGISQSYVAGLEAGDRKGDPLLLKRLAGALGVRMEDLVSE